MQPCDAVKPYILCLDDLVLSDTEYRDAMDPITFYECDDPSPGVQVDTVDDGSLLFTTDYDKTMVFQRRSADAIDIVQLSDQIDALEQLAARLPYVHFVA